MRISYDLDEALGKVILTWRNFCIGRLYQWMLYNDLQSLHQVFDNDYEIDQDSFQLACKKAGANLKREEISRIFERFSRNMMLDYEAIADIFEEKKKDDLFMAKF